MYMRLLLIICLYIHIVCRRNTPTPIKNYIHSRSGASHAVDASILASPFHCTLHSSPSVFTPLKTSIKPCKCHYLLTQYVMEAGLAGLCNTSHRSNLSSVSIPYSDTTHTMG